MALQTRNTVFAITEEVTEGTPVFPTAGTDFSAFQEGFSVEPAFETLDSTELQSSIGKTKSTLGFENPTATVNHYFRHSGVEGTAPDYAKLIKSAMGTQSINSTERLTAAASTTTLLKLAAGGSDFARGKAVLVKDSSMTNGYGVRNVSSVAGNDLTLAQALMTAPVAGVGVGKCVHFGVANSGHPTLNLFTYRANGGALELLAGGRVTELGLTFNAGEYINAAFTMAGISYYFDPIELTSSNNKLDFNDGGAQSVTIAAKTYKDPYELAAAIQTAMDAASTDTITCTYSDTTQKFTITSNGATLSLLFLTGPNTAQTIATKLGFLVADYSAALTYTSDNAISFAAPFTPSYDSSDALVAKYNQVMIGTQTEVTCFDAQSVTVTLSNTKTDLTSICAESGKSGSLFSARDVSVEVVAYLSQGQAEEFKRFRSNDEIIFTYNGGQKSGGNWVAGTVVNAHIPTARIASFSLGDSDGIVTLNMTLQAFVKDGQGEFYINML